MLAAIHEDLTVAVNIAFENEEQAAGSAGDRPGVGSHARHSCGQAVGLRILPGFARFHQIFCCGL